MSYAAGPELHALAERLAGDAPVQERGVALARALPRSKVPAPEDAAAFRASVLAALAALDPRRATAPPPPPAG